MSSVVYFLRGQPSGLIKIGWSANIEKRLANLTGLSPERLEILATVKGGRVLEEHLHATSRPTGFTENGSYHPRIS